MAGQIRVIRSVIFLLVMILQTSCWQVSSNRLFSTCPRGGATIDKLASKLNISRRTLQRRLSDRDTNFLNVLQEVRSKVALRYLGDGRLGITEIGLFAGLCRSGLFF